MTMQHFALHLFMDRDAIIFSVPHGQSHIL